MSTTLDSFCPSDTIICVRRTRTVAGSSFGRKIRIRVRESADSVVRCEKSLAGLRSIGVSIRPRAGAIDSKPEGGRVTNSKTAFGVIAAAALLAGCGSQMIPKIVMEGTTATIALPADLDIGYGRA